MNLSYVDEGVGGREQALHTYIYIYMYNIYIYNTVCTKIDANGLLTGCAAMSLIYSLL
jgi:hypothetical protein